MFSRRGHVAAASFDTPPYLLKYRLPTLPERMRFERDATDFIASTSLFLKRHAEHRKEHGFESYEDPKAFVKDHPFMMTVPYFDTEAVFDFLASITLEVEGLEDEDGPFKWDDLDTSDKHRFFEESFSVITVISYYLDVLGTFAQKERDAHDQPDPTEVETSHV